MEMTSGCIYAIAALRTPYVKIGSTVGTPAKRCQNLQVGQPCDLAVVASVAVPHSLGTIERHIHKLLGHHHRRGEWFALEMDTVKLAKLIAIASAELRLDLTQAATPPPLASRVQQLRQALGWSQAQLARRAGETLACIKRTESGKHSHLMLSAVQGIARAFGVS